MVIDCPLLFCSYFLIPKTGRRAIIQVDGKTTSLFSAIWIRTTKFIFATCQHTMRISLIIFCGLFVLAFTEAVKTVPTNKMLDNAEDLLRHINRDNTDYRHKEELVTWGDRDLPYQSYADCSGFVNALIKKTYDSALPFKSWLGKSRPLAIQYYQAVITENHFTRINNIGDIQPGDLVVLKYADESEHEDNTGHCMLVEKKPVGIDPVSKLEPGSLQYAIGVIDSSKSPHGKEDSRYSPDGNPYAGLGRGTFRLYTDGKGNITGYSWSPGKPLAGFDPFANPVVVGRITL